MAVARGAGPGGISGPESADAALEQARAAAARGDPGQAQRLLDRALDLGADAGEVHYRSGLLHLAAGRIEDAADSFEVATHLRSDAYPAWLELSAVNLQLARHDAALEAALAATSLPQAGPQSFNNLGLAARAVGRYEDAERALREALARNAAFHAARANLGLLLKDLGRTDDAIAQFEAVLAGHPDDDEVLWNLAVTRLANGEYRAGWEDYEKRWLQHGVARRHFDLPTWQGDPPGTRRIFVYGEQGIGDEIMFASCMPDAVRRGGTWMLECAPRLETLFRRSFPMVEVIPAPARPGDAGERISGADLQLAAGSLPHRLGRDAASFPAHDGYLRAEPRKVESWRRRLEQLGPGLKVGISWRGGDPRTGRRIRSIDVAQLAPLLRTDHCRFVSLQYGEVEADCHALRRDHGIVLPHWPEAQVDFDELAALVSALDLVISVTTATAHLTGALGKPGWILVPASPEWRYGISGERMPWYPSLRLLRQGTALDWTPVLARAAGELRALPRAAPPGR